jgi:hypothetical protein
VAARWNGQILISVRENTYCAVLWRTISWRYFGLPEDGAPASAETCRSKIDILSIWFTLKNAFRWSLFQHNLKMRGPDYKKESTYDYLITIEVFGEDCKLERLSLCNPLNIRVTSSPLAPDPSLSPSTSPSHTLSLASSHNATHLHLHKNVRWIPSHAVCVTKIRNVLTSYTTLWNFFLHFFFFLWGWRKSCLAHFSHSRHFVLNPALVPPFISRGTPRQTAWETSISERRNYGREMAGQI